MLVIGIKLSKDHPVAYGEWIVIINSGHFSTIVVRNYVTSANKLIVGDYAYHTVIAMLTCFGGP